MKGLYFLISLFCIFTFLTSCQSDPYAWMDDPGDGLYAKEEVQEKVIELAEAVMGNTLDPSEYLKPDFSLIEGRSSYFKVTFINGSVMPFYTVYKDDYEKTGRFVLNKSRAFVILTDNETPNQRSTPGNYLIAIADGKLIPAKRTEGFDSGLERHGWLKPDLLDYLDFIKSEYGDDYDESSIKLTCFVTKEQDAEQYQYFNLFQYYFFIKGKNGKPDSLIKAEYISYVDGSREYKILYAPEKKFKTVTFTPVG